MKTTEELQREFIVNQTYGTNHLLHLLITVITLGFWLPVWVLITANNASKRADVNDTASGKILRVAGRVLTTALFLCFAAAAAAAIIAISLPRDAAAADAWSPEIPAPRDNMGLSFKNQSYEEVPIGPDMTSMMTVRFRYGQNYEFYQAGIKQKDCDRGRGTIMFFDMNGVQQTERNASFVKDGGTIGSGVAYVICGLYDRFRTNRK